MRIKELIERECCDAMKSDLEPCPWKNKRKARYFEPDLVFTCKHCGQKWQWEIYMDAAGGQDTRLVKIK